ncbi:hypothetical protein OROMI_014563 [Orobanche minor]
MASTLEEVKWSGGSEQKSGGGSGKDGSSETREEQQMEEGGSEAVPVDLKKQKEDNNEQGGSGGGSGKDDDGSSSGTDSSSKTKKLWYLVSPTDPIEDEDEVDEDEDEEERAERKEGIYYIRSGYGLSYAMETDNAVAFIYIMRYFAARDSEAEDMYLVQAIRGEKYSIVKALLRQETTNLLANIGSGNALHFACEKRHEPLACLLIEHARNKGVLRQLITDTKYRDGLTPIDVAKIRGLHEVLGLLNEIARSVRNAKANLSEANLSEDKTAGSSTKLAETNPSKKQKMQV